MLSLARGFVLVQTFGLGQAVAKVSTGGRGAAGGPARVLLCSKLCELPVPRSVTMRIYVGNLADETGEEQLREMFLPHGRVKDVRVARDEAGASRGFGIVIFETAKAAAAIAALSGCVAAGRTLRVKEATPRP